MKIIIKLIKAKYAISIEELSFKYFSADLNIFENLIKIENKHTIITGPNGSAKSTLLGLISKSFLSTYGKIVSFVNFNMLCYTLYGCKFKR